MKRTFDVNDPMIAEIKAILGEDGGPDDYRRKKAEAQSEKDDEDDATGKDKKPSGKKEKITIDPQIPNPNSADNLK